MLGVAALVALGVTGYVYGVEPAMERQAVTRELTAARRALLARQKRLVARTERHGREMEALRAEIAQRRARLLPGDRAPVAASELQKLVKDLATAASVDVRSERVIAPVDLTGVLEIPIELTVACTIRQMVTLLNQLEQTPRLLRVRDLKIRVAAPGQPRELLTTLVVSGYLRSGK